MSAMPQFTEELVNVGRIVPRVATAMLDGISMFRLWWKSGNTTGGAARSSPAAPSSSECSTDSSARSPGPSSTVALAAGVAGGDVGADRPGCLVPRRPAAMTVSCTLFLASVWRFVEGGRPTQKSSGYGAELGVLSAGLERT